MGWGSKLGKILSVAGPIAASFIPGGGAVGMLAKAGKMGKILGTAGKIGGAISPILGQAAGARAEAKHDEEGQQLTRDQLNQSADRANMALPANRLATAARANIGSAEPIKFNMAMPGAGLRGEHSSFSGGGMTPDPRMKQIASSVMDQMLHDQLTGGGGVREATPAPKSSFGDKLLSGGAFGAGMAGAIGTMLPKQGAAPASPMGNIDPEEDDPYYYKRPAENGRILNPELMRF